MRIGVMLRHVDQHPGGVRVYTRELMEALLTRVEHDHRLVFLYDDVSAAGTFDTGDRHEESVLRLPSRLLWDQVAVPRAVREHRIDVLFNPKYSVPLVAGVPRVFVCHGLDWYVMPQASRWPDRISHRLLVPRYARAAARIIAVSETVRRDVVRHLGVAPERVRAIHSGVSAAFRRPVPPRERREVRDALELPERFFLYCGQIYPPKNFGRLLEAHRRVGPELRIPLVVAGRHAFLCEDEVREARDPARHPWVRWLDWVERSRLPALYSLAEGLLLPSLYEGFGFPLLEAMASGCPVLTSDRTACLELASGAAVLVDPEDTADIERGIRELAGDAGLRDRLRRAGRERAESFTWERCARDTLRVLEAAVG